MAAVKTTTTGVLIDLTGRTISGPLKLVGETVYSDRGVGGGPIMPPPEGGNGEGEGEGPPSIWPSPGHPAHPIVIPPEVWPDPPNPDAPHPEHPIVIPPPADIPQAPPLEVKTVWTVREGWQVVLVPTGEHPTPSGGGRRR